MSDTRVGTCVNCGERGLDNLKRGLCPACYTYQRNHHGQARPAHVYNRRRPSGPIRERRRYRELPVTEYVPPGGTADICECGNPATTDMVLTVNYREMLYHLCDACAALEAAPVE